MHNWYKTAQDFERAIPEELLNELGMTVEGQGYVIIGKSGAQTAWYCESLTQGGRMLPISTTMAKVFPLRKDAEKRMEELKVIFNGIEDWAILPTIL